MLSWPSSVQRSLAFFRTHGYKLQPTNGSKVVVAMSGGVDSSVVAKLMAEKNYDLSAIFMRNWDTRDESGTDDGCEWKKDWADVQQTCKMLDIPCKLVNLTSEYWTRVFQPSLEAWEAGATPNPDIWCNKEIKFGALMKHLGDEETWIATGHYAKKGWSVKPYPPSRLVKASSFEDSIRPMLLRPKDRNKDQTYYLSSVPERSLARALFPLAPYTKTEIKEMAHQWNLPTADKRESMGICFVGKKRKFDDFISEYIPPKRGLIIDQITGKKVGEHNGLWHYTVGQNAKLTGMPVRMFVSGRDLERNIIYVVPGADHEALYCGEIHVRGWQWIWDNWSPAGLDQPSGFRARAQYRYRMEDVPCTVYRGKGPDALRIVFDQPQKSISAGQVAAIWDGDWCLGCGLIEGTS